MLEIRGVMLLLSDGSGGGNFTGNGNSEPFVFLRLGSRKNVVVVDTVCVVVVVAYIPWSPEDPSDLEDSDSLETGRARVEFVSSP